MAVPAELVASSDGIAVTICPLPAELWREIALSISAPATGAHQQYIDPAVYWVLVRVAKSMEIPHALPMFIRVIKVGDGLRYCLPNSFDE